MDLERFTERSRSFIQTAQGVAAQNGHQQFTPSHLLKVLLQDETGLSNSLIRLAGGDPHTALSTVEANIKKLPKVDGNGVGQIYVSAKAADVFDQAIDFANKLGDRFISVELILQALCATKGTAAAKALSEIPKI